MIEQASLQIAADGGVLVILPRTGMRLDGDTTFQVVDGRLRIGQYGTCFVSAAFESLADADLVLGNQDVSIVESDEAGMEFHQRVREART